MNILGGMLSSNFGKLSPVELKEQYVDANVEHTLVDVRSPSEYRSGHVPHAVSIPLNELGNRISEIPTDKPVMLICASGNRSRSAANMLVKAGYDDVYNITGGTSMWMMHQFPVER